MLTDCMRSIAIVCCSKKVGLFKKVLGLLAQLENKL